jgi:hypothetical protein
MSNSASTLYYVSVENNHLTGTTPTSWNKLTLLGTLGLAFNEFKGSPGCVHHMPKLNAVYGCEEQPAASSRPSGRIYHLYIYLLEVQLVQSQISVMSGEHMLGNPPSCLSKGAALIASRH